MKHKRTLILISALLIATAAFAFLHLSGRTDVQPGEVIILSNGRERILSVSDLPLTGVDGEITNAKGDVLAVSGSGVPLADVLAGAEIDPYALETVAVIASDEYRAELTSEEIRTPEKVWLTVQEDGSLRLIVFGDPDSRRNVTNVVRMEVK